MTQWVVIKKDDLESEVVLESAELVWVPVMGWEIVGEPTNAPTRDPFEYASAEQSTEESTAEDTPAESAPAPAAEAAPTESAPSA